jgi:hypothetical protein
LWGWAVHPRHVNTMSHVDFGAGFSFLLLFLGPCSGCFVGFFFFCPLWGAQHFLWSGVNRCKSILEPWSISLLRF